MTLGGGDVAVRAGGDILAARIDVASGTALLAAGGRIGGLQVQTGTNGFQYRDPSGAFRSVVLPTLVANGSIVLSNAAPQSPSIYGARIGSYAIYPGTFTLAALMGDANLRAFAAPPGYSAPNQNAALAPPEYNFDAPSAILMTPSPTEQLSILAGGNIIVRTQNNNYDETRFQYQFEFPRMFSNTSEAKLERQHNQNTTHAGDATPAYVYAGGDIGTAVSGVHSR